MIDTYIGSVEEHVTDEYESQAIDTHWQARQGKRARLLRELNDLDQSIVIAKRAGKNTERMKRDWLRLLGEFEAVCRQINGSAT